MILDTILYILSFLLIWQFVGYPIFMACLAIMFRPIDKDYSYQPFISVLVPTYKEEKVIKKRIENLLNLNYPKDKYEIIIVDSASRDSTVAIVETAMQNNQNIKLIRENYRRGKASAINIGKKHTKGDIILVTDANSTFDENVLREIAPLFKNPKIGAVGGQYIVQNTGEHLTDSTQFYWDIEYIMRKGERILDSACLFHGEINAWRKNLVDNVNTLSEDLDTAIQIRKKGYMIEYEPNAIVYEPAPSTVDEQIKQRKRTSIGTIQNLFKYWNYFLFPRDWYSLVIFPSHKGLVMVSPFMLFAIPIIYIIIWNLYIIAYHILLSLFIFGTLLGVLMYLKSILRNTKNKTQNKRFSMPKIAYYVILNEYLILLAWKDFILGKYSVTWEKVESTR